MIEKNLVLIFFLISLYSQIGNMYLNNSVLYHAASCKKHTEYSMSIKQWSKSKHDPNHSSTIRTAQIVLQQINQYI